MKERNRSLWFTMPTTCLPSMTGRQLMFRFAMIWAASSTVLSSVMVATSLTIILSTVILARRVGISHKESRVAGTGRRCAGRSGR